jgi:hypothetical protein
MTLSGNDNFHRKRYTIVAVSAGGGWREFTARHVAVGHGAIGTIGDSLGSWSVGRPPELVTVWKAKIELEKLDMVFADLKPGLLRALGL